VIEVKTDNLGDPMHSNFHLGISLAAMSHVAPVAELHNLNNQAMNKDWGDTDEMLKFVPGFVRGVPRGRPRSAGAAKGIRLMEKHGTRPRFRQPSPYSESV